MEPRVPTWRKSRRSSGGDNCVEVRLTGCGDVGVRDSKEPEGPILTFTSAGWTTFTRGLRHNEFRT